MKLYVFALAVLFSGPSLAQLPAPPLPVPPKIGISVPGGPVLPAAGVANIQITFESGFPMGVVLSRGANAEFARWPIGPLSQYFSRTENGLKFALCLSCVPQGPLSLGVVAEYGGTSTAKTDVVIGTPAVPGDTPPIPIPPKPIPSVGRYPANGAYTAVQPPSLQKPGYLVPIKDPVFGTKITRITDAGVFGTANVRHDYSKVQPWNSDQTLVRVNQWILDGANYKIVRTIALYSELRWSTVDPKKLFAVSGNRLISMNADTGATTVLLTFRQGPVQMGPWEGSPSVGDKYVALLAGGNVVVYDIQNNVVVSSKALSSIPNAVAGFDWVGMSQSGEYVVIAANITQSFDRNLNFKASLYPFHPHGDLGYDSSGNEVFVTACPSQMVRLSGGPRINLLGVSECGHASARNYKRPGWGYFNFSPGRPTDLVAVKLDGSKTVERFGHHRSTQAIYEAQAQSVPSPDGTKVMFASNWGGGEVNAYVAEVW